MTLWNNRQHSTSHKHTTILNDAWDTWRHLTTLNDTRWHSMALRETYGTQGDSTTLSNTWWQLSMLDDTRWHSMTAADKLLMTLETFDDTQGHLMTLADTQRHLRILNEIRWYSKTRDNTRWHVTTLDDTWQHLTTLSDTLWHFTTLWQTHSTTLGQTPWPHSARLAGTWWHSQYSTTLINTRWQSTTFESFDITWQHLTTRYNTLQHMTLSWSA